MDKLLEGDNQNSEKYGGTFFKTNDITVYTNDPHSAANVVFTWSSSTICT
jgi:hypothetical protein